MARHIVAIVGDNANGILRCQSERFLDFTRQAGFVPHVLDIRDTDFALSLCRLLDDGIAFVWAYAGIGSRLRHGGRGFWDGAGIPFICVHADAPYIMPIHHGAGSAFVVNGYIYREWLELQQEVIGAPQISAMLPHGVIANPDRHTMPLSARPTRMLFVKSGEDPAQRRAGWERWPARLRPVLEDCAATLATLEPGPILPVLRDCLRAYDLVLDGAKPLLFRLLDELDVYIRSLRATVVARALLPLSADIVGSGWQHLHGEPGRARFHPAMPARELDARYAQTQILVNTTPNFASGAHERVLRGFAARCLIASDQNAYGRQQLDRLPSYHGFDWRDAGLSEQLAAVFHTARADEGGLDQAEAFVTKRHDPMHFLARLAELADLVRLQGTLGAYALDAA